MERYGPEQGRRRCSGAAAGLTLPRVLDAYLGVVRRDRTVLVRRRDFLLGTLGAALAGTNVRGDDLHWHDVHMHVVGGRDESFGEAVDGAIAAMDQFGIAKAVIFPPPTPRAGIFDYTDYVPELRRHPGRFGFLAGGGTLNPMLQQTQPADVTPAIKQNWTDTANRMLDAGAAGFGEIAVLHLSLVPNHPFEETEADHPLLLLLVEVADQRKAVIDLHMDPVSDGSMGLPTSLKAPPNPKQLKGNVAALERLLAHGPDARIVWAHGGSDFTGNMTPHLIGALMERHSNLYMSLRPIPALAAANNPFGLQFQNLLLTPEGIDPNWLALLQKHSDRFVMGGDTFFVSSSVNTERAAVALSRGNEPRLRAARVALERMPPDLAKKIGLTNAQRLYKI